MGLPPLNRSTRPVPHKPERILQFGEGNFLRCFADWAIQRMNVKGVFDAGVAIVQPIQQGLINLLNEQNGLYTVCLTALDSGVTIRTSELVDCIQRGINPYADFTGFLQTAHNPDMQFVVSNTTEAGIAFSSKDKLEDSPPNSFPGKLTRWLWERFQAFSGATDKGVVLLPCELIDKNGQTLKSTVLQFAQSWSLPDAFSEWVNQACVFCNTLVDRIVPGYPKDRVHALQAELGYEDKLLVEGEYFHLWVIEAPDHVAKQFPAPAAGLNVIFTKDLTPYRDRKVRILNGAHTSMVPIGYLSALSTVKETVEHGLIGRFVRDLVFEEIIPTLDLPQEALQQYANEVLGRFRNPFIRHELLSIGLNSISKFQTRVLPSLLAFRHRKKHLPKRIVFSLAALIRFYAGEFGGETIPLNDNSLWVEWFHGLWSRERHGTIRLEDLVKEVLSRKEIWGSDLTHVEGLTELTTEYLQAIDLGEMEQVLKSFSRPGSH